MYEKHFDDTVEEDTSKPVMVYQLTRADSILFDYQDSGHYEFMVYQDEQREQDGYYVIDGKGYWLCDKPSERNRDKNEPLVCEICCDSNEIYNGLEAGEFTAKFYDSDGNETHINPIWDIVCDFRDDLNVSYVGNVILISVNNSALVNKSFELFLNGYRYEPISIRIDIKAFL